MEETPLVIAEVKTESPFGWRSDRNWGELFDIAEEIGDIISIHTDARWGGSFELLEQARKRTRKPILAKGVHETDSGVEEAVRVGANHVLVVGRVPGVHLDKCMIEPYTLAELSSLPQDVKAVWNSRDLRTGGVKEETFSSAREVFSGWLCQASNIRSVADVEAGADAVLVGTHIEQFRDSLKSF